MNNATTNTIQYFRVFIAYTAGRRNMGKAYMVRTSKGKGKATLSALHALQATYGEARINSIKVI